MVAMSNTKSGKYTVVGGNMMKSMRLLSLTLISFSLTTQLTFGQEKVEIEETYIRKDIPKPFFVRWIKDLFRSSFGQITKLELRNMDKKSQRTSFES